MKKVIMLLLAVGSATVSFAETGKSPATATATAARPAVAGSAVKAPQPAQRRQSCTVVVYDMGSDGYMHRYTATASCDCSHGDACATAQAALDDYMGC